ncbi:MULTISPECIES: DUF488 domain-containing protein [Halorussus]|uniref:DUF488 domain-containing protein n=1 Tax=Halorussus TaxID=1070314 RepID=UPI0020A14B82|nr:DUF488 domain-containing protein [Halorussus vallis]USZ75178.1 DUF488 domain-containing protein [Halorussus vallis]
MTEENLRHTYLAAIQHDKVEIPDEAAVFGVCRRPTRWLNAAIDENLPAVAPPDHLLSAAKILTEERGHNEAWDALNFDEVYREHLRSSPDAQQTMDRIREVAESRPVYLVCFENLDDKRCHRVALVEELRKGT